MIYPVKIYDKDGKLKEFLDKEKVNKLFWTTFYIESGSYEPNQMEVDESVFKKIAKKIICKMCKKEANSTGRNTKYCSAECKTKFNNAKTRLKNKEQYMVECKIEDCKNKFKTTGKQKYCSVPCKKIANKLKNRAKDAKTKAILKKIKEKRDRHVV